MSNSIMIWLALCTFLVLLMQAGFACYEAGMVRRKNSVNVAIKNVADLGTTIVAYLLVGYTLMFGESWHGLIGTGPSVMLEGGAQDLLVALFQAMFCGTAITIVSGAVSERTSFRGYLLLAVSMSVLVYPVTGHWAWAEGGWLLALGFHDFAGSTVVHAVGGAIALAAVLRIGPRLGRFNRADGRRAGIDGDNLAVSALGAFLLMFGWFGFNSGGATDFVHEVPLVLVNTAIGAASGIVAVLVMAWMRGRKPSANDILTSMLGGLVAITAGCAVIPPVGAAALGGLGGLVAVGGLRLLDRWHIDDPVGAIPVHLFAGVAGTVLLPLLAEPETIPAVVSGRLEWVAVQALGAAVLTATSFSVAWVVMALTDRFVHYRVAPEDERIGLNIAEHGAGTAMLDLLDQLAAQGRKGDFSEPVAVEEETDAAHIAAFYNQVRERFVRESERSRELLEEAAHLAHHDPLTGLKNRRAFMHTAEEVFALLARYDGRAALVMIDVDHFKAVNDTHGHNVGDEVLIELARRLTRVARGTDAVARLGGEEFAVLVNQATLDEALVAAQRLRQAVTEPAFSVSIGDLPVTASLGVAPLDPNTSVDEALKAADDALYAAKAAGRNRVQRASVAAGAGFKTAPGAVAGAGAGAVAAPATGD